MIQMNSFSISIFIPSGNPLNILLIFFCVISFHAVLAQKPPMKSDTASVTLRGGTFHIGNGEIIHDGHLLFKNGKITYIGTEEQSADRIIDVSDQHVYPGLIAINTNLGLTEVDAVRATRDFQEVGQYNPHLRALIAYNTDSEIIPTIRSNGILLAEIAPRGGIISGQSTVVQLDAWNWEDAVICDTAAFHLNWPALYRYNRAEQRTEINKDYASQVRKIDEYFSEASAYGKMEHPYPVNLKLKALSSLLKKETPVFVHVNDEKAIRDVVQFGKKKGLPIVLTGASDAWKIADELAEKKIPVILGPTQSLPRNVDTDIDQPFKTPKILQEAGVLWCFSHSGSWDQRNLPFQGGQAVAFGLDQEAALTGMTLSTAKILNIDQAYGTLEKGKSATLVISDGNILDPPTSIILQAFIDGREIDLDNKQKKLYRKYGEKYNILR